jgi:phenylacetate-coenzyme A ligase PaaK-like adenylate-forming protein
LHAVSFLQPLPRLVESLNALQPTTLATYPSVAVLLAQEQSAGRLRISPWRVWTGGEALTPAMRARVSQAFGAEVVGSYGASEFLSIASECEHGVLHVNSDWVLLEPVDERGRPVPPGCGSVTTLLTNLANHVQPLIRYDLGDRLTVMERACACGSRLPAVQVVGRADDQLRLCRRDGRPVDLPPLALCTVLEDEAGLFDFQLVQQGPRDLLLQSPVHGRDAARMMRRARVVLLAYLNCQGLECVRVRSRTGAASTVGASGKHPRIVADASGVPDVAPRAVMHRC